MKSRPLLLALALSSFSMNSFGFLGFGGTRWTEDALLHNGTVLLVERNVERGGRHEIGQKPPYRQQWLQFKHLATGKKVIWEDLNAEDIGTASFLPMLVDIVAKTPYVVVTPMGCLSYNKWGRPNPPYVVFRYEGERWTRIPLSDLPKEIIIPNLISSAPDIEIERLGKTHVTVDDVKRANSGFKQPEYKSILRTEIPVGSYSSSVNCEEMVYYKGAWVGPGDSIGKRMMDRKSK